ncbi:MAG: DNA-directed RNA polymerase subunit D [Candidatus Bilamarchaeaceae archaeon]
MKATLAEWKENKLSFRVEDADIPILNAVRRYSMSRVPVLAVEKVIIYENNSSMFDEYIAHRVGLIPLVTPAGISADTEVGFLLDASGPKVVYSGEMKSADAEVVAAKDKIPILTLFEGQNLRFEGTAKVGTGRKHAKYQAGIASYGEEEGGKEGILFRAESFFQMSPKEMLLRGCRQLEKDLEELGKSVKKSLK